MLVPTAKPETTSVEVEIVATDVLLLVHVPLLVISLSVDVDPTQTLVVPMIGEGDGLTVKGVVAVQPVDERV